MTIVWSRLVKTEGIAFLLLGGVLVGAAGALAAFWAQVRVGSGTIGLDGGGSAGGRSRLFALLLL